MPERVFFMGKREVKKERRFWAGLLRGLLIAIAAAVCLCAAASFAVLRGWLGPDAAAACVTAFAGLGCLIGGAAAARALGRKRLPAGAAVGVCFWLVTAGVGYGLFQDGFSWLLAGKLAAVELCCGGAGGILTAGRKNRRK